MSLCQIVREFRECEWGSCCERQQRQDLCVWPEPILIDSGVVCDGGFRDLGWRCGRRESNPHGVSPNDV